MRWQIELLFKLWKSHGRVDESRSTKPWRILCEVYAKLLAMLVQHWVFLVSFWAYPDRSLTKAAQTVQKHALHLASAFTERPAPGEGALDGQALPRGGVQDESAEKASQHLSTLTAGNRSMTRGLA